MQPILPSSSCGHPAAQLTRPSSSSSLSPPPRVESSLPTQTDSCTNSLHCKKLNHTVFFSFFCGFCFPQLFFVFLNSIIINIVQNVTKENVHLVFCVFFYTRQAEADYYVYRRSSPSSPPLTSVTSAATPPPSVSDSECFHMRPPSPPSLRPPDPSTDRTSQTIALK